MTDAPKTPISKRKLALRIVGVVGLAFGLSALGRAYVRGTLTAPERMDPEGLQTGNVESRLIERGGRLWVQFSYLIDAPARHIWKVIRDYDRMAEFMPNSAKIEKLPSGHVKLEFGFFGLKRDSEIHLDDDASPMQCVETWHQVRGTMKTNRGRWVLVPLAGDRTFARYEIDVESGLWIPGWMERAIVRDALRVVLWRVEARVKSLPDAYFRE